MFSTDRRDVARDKELDSHQRVSHNQCSKTRSHRVDPAHGSSFLPRWWRSSRSSSLISSTASATVDISSLLSAWDNRHAHLSIPKTWVLLRSRIKPQHLLPEVSATSARLAHATHDQPVASGPHLCRSTFRTLPYLGACHTSSPQSSRIIGPG